jgi:hypothetical protein
VEEAPRKYSKYCMPEAWSDQTSATFPGGPPADLPHSLPDNELRRRARPRKMVPAGTWDDDSLLADVQAVIGTTDERHDDGAEIFEAICRLAAQELRSKLMTARKDVLKSLVFGGRGRSGQHIDAQKASVIARTIVGWRHGVGERDVRRMQRAGGTPATMIYR